MTKIHFFLRLRKKVCNHCIIIYNHYIKSLYIESLNGARMLRILCIFRMKSPVFSFINEKNTVFFCKLKEKHYLCNILKIYVTMTESIIKQHFCMLWCGKRKRPNALTYRRRTPKACFLFIPKFIRYVTHKSFAFQCS